MMNQKENKQLLVFSYGLPLICFVLAWRQYAKHGLTVWVEGFFIVGSIVLLMALFAPSVSKLIFKYWMKVAQAIGKIVTIFILTIFFFCVITPVSIILRLIGKDFMRLRSKIKENSYWVKREDIKADYTQQF